MGGIDFIGRRWTWANNRQGKGFIEKMLDVFFRSVEWMLEFNQAQLQHTLNQSSDHSMLLQDTKPQQAKRRSRFIFDSRWSREQGCVETIQKNWNVEVEGECSDFTKESSIVGRGPRVEKKGNNKF